MAQVLNLFKPVGVTPLQLLEQLRKVSPEYSSSKLGYIGKLDPMAKGIVVVMVDETNQEIETFKGLDKRYECTFVLGVDTDSYDILGKVIPRSTSTNHLEEAVKQLPQHLSRLKGERSQPYPPFSGVKVQGKPLFEWARTQQLDSITIPEKRITVYSIELLSHSLIPKSSFLQEVRKRVNLLHGDFRQKEILESWESWSDHIEPDHLPVCTLSVHCSSGTYVREIIHRVGQTLTVGATVIEVFRTGYGSFNYQDSLHLFYDQPHL